MFDYTITKEEQLDFISSLELAKQDVYKTESTLDLVDFIQQRFSVMFSHLVLKELAGVSKKDDIANALSRLIGRVKDVQTVTIVLGFEPSRMFIKEIGNKLAKLYNLDSPIVVGVEYDKRLLAGFTSIYNGHKIERGLAYDRV